MADYSRYPRISNEDFIGDTGIIGNESRFSRSQSAGIRRKRGDDEELGEGSLRFKKLWKKSEAVQQEDRLGLARNREEKKALDAAERKRKKAEIYQHKPKVPLGSARRVRSKTTGPKRVKKAVTSEDSAQVAKNALDKKARKEEFVSKNAQKDTPNDDGSSMQGIENNVGNESGAGEVGEASSSTAEAETEKPVKSKKRVMKNAEVSQPEKDSDRPQTPTPGQRAKKDRAEKASKSNSPDSPEKVIEDLKEAKESKPAAAPMDTDKTKTTPASEDIDGDKKMDDGDPGPSTPHPPKASESASNPEPMNVEDNKSKGKDEVTGDGFDEEKTYSLDDVQRAYQEGVAAGGKAAKEAARSQNIFGGDTPMRDPYSMSTKAKLGRIDQYLEEGRKLEEYGETNPLRTPYNIAVDDDEDSVFKKLSELSEEKLSKEVLKMEGLIKKAWANRTARIAKEEEIEHRKKIAAIKTEEDEKIRKILEKEKADIEKQMAAFKQIAALQLQQARAARSAGFRRPRKAPARVGSATAAPSGRDRAAVGKRRPKKKSPKKESPTKTANKKRKAAPKKTTSSKKKTKKT